jgi:2,4-dienoyl-CoA reductase (NADPH2)
MQSLHAALFQPIAVGKITLPNRFVMGSMHTGLEGHPDRFAELGRFYADRARGGCALIVTGGFAPNFAGRMVDDCGTFDREDQVPFHRQVTTLVHDAQGRIILQILHAGRYGYHSSIVAPSAIKTSINSNSPKMMTASDIAQTIADYTTTAHLARESGYDGVEVMGSEGYLLSEYLAIRTNKRDDEWGGSLENRARFPLAVIRAVRRALGDDLILSYRISALELVDGGLGKEETLWFAKEVEKAGANCLTTGIGWHESTVPTIAGTVPHAAFAEDTRRLKSAVSIPVAASNRINLPADSARLVIDGFADIVSMARPFLADANFVKKVMNGQSSLINVCIACNQACLDHYFTNQVISCLVNPRAAHETHFIDQPASRSKRIAVVGGGVAGIAAALEAARRGHSVTLYEKAPDIGGQFAFAAQIPGKQDYGRALVGLKNQLVAQGVDIRIKQNVTIDTLAIGNFEDVVIATGVNARKIDIPGSDDPRVVPYPKILDGSVVAGKSVVIIGGGGIGHDVALFLAQGAASSEQTIAEYEARWGIYKERKLPLPLRSVTMVKRSPGPFGRTLGKTTGWIVRQELKDLGVRQISNATYLKIDKKGLHISVQGTTEILAADTIVVCAGQVSSRKLADQLVAKGQTIHVIGGATLASELDAKRAISEGAIIGNRF